MAWSVTIEEIVKQTSSLIVRVALSDGVNIIRPDEYKVTSEIELKTKINADIAKLTELEVDLHKISVGPYDPTIQAVISVADEPITP